MSSTTGMDLEANPSAVNSTPSNPFGYAGNPEDSVEDTRVRPKAATRQTAYDLYTKGEEEVVQDDEIEGITFSYLYGILRTQFMAIRQRILIDMDLYPIDHLKVENRPANHVFNNEATLVLYHMCKEKEFHGFQCIRLLERGANPNYVNKGKADTPLHWATRRGNITVMRLLLYAGADPFALDSRHRNSLHIASESRRPEQVLAVRLLLKQKGMRTKLELRDAGMLCIHLMCVLYD